MANITQKISSYIQGISQQPDHLKRSGQVSELLNVLPDVTIGCQKRPGSELVAKLHTSKGGKWFTIFRDNNEKYLVQYIDGQLRLWSAIDGTPRVVRYSSIPVNPANPDGPAAPPDSLPPPLPSGCNPTLMNTKLSAWLAKKEEGDAEASKISNYYAQIDAIRAAARQEWQLAEERYQPNNPNPYCVSDNTPYWNGAVVSLGNEFRRGPFKASYLGGATVYAIQRWALITIIDQVSIDNLNAQIATANTNLQTIRAAETPLRKAYEAEAVKCGITESPVSMSTATNTIPYLNGAEPEDISILTVNDYTFITNRKRVVTMGTDKSNVRPYEAFIQVKTLEYNTEYKLDITAPGAQQDVQIPYATALTVEPSDWTDGDGNCPMADTQVFDHTDGAKINMRYQLETRGQAIPNGSYDYDCSYKTYVTLLNGGQGWVTGDAWTVTMKGRSYTVRVKSHSYENRYQPLITIAPFLTPKDQSTGVLKADSILNHFKTEIEKNFGWFATVIGTGLYIKGAKQFSASATGGRTSDAIDVMTNKVNNVSRLPIQCKDGYVVKVLNTGEQEDDYYVKFIGTEAGVDGAGAWEETIAPGIAVNFNYSSMPHQLIRLADGTFSFSPVDWDNREVGDDKTCPQPSFVENTINKMLFYRNRLCMLSDENIIMSRAGDFFNFWSKTAITISDDDPIDLATSSTSPTILYSGLDLQQGLVLFSSTKQFILATNQDLLSPQTARIEQVSTYDYNPATPLIDMGTTIGFLASSGKYARYFEMTNISDFTPEIIEQSKIVAELIPSEAHEVAQSKENTLVGIGLRGTRDVTLYRYFNDGTKRIMSSWFQWKLSSDLIHHAISNDIYYVVSEDNGNVILSKVSIVPTTSQYIINNTNVRYTPRLDSYKVITQNEVSYDQRSDTTTFNVNYPYTKSAVVFGITTGRNHGRVADVKTITTNPDDTWTITVDGDWSHTSIVIGYQYTMKVGIPHLFMSKESDDKSLTDTRSYLTIHRNKFQFGAIGMFELDIKAPSKEPRHYRFEMSPANHYKANTHEVLPSVFHTVPVYEKNINVEMTLSSTHPTPCTLLSMEWEGKLTTKHYTRV